MTFWISLLAVNFVSFLPYYLLNVRQQPNPIAFFTEKRLRSRNLKDLLFSKLDHTDPFRIHFEFSLILLLFLLLDMPPQTTIILSSIVLLCSEVYLIYLCIMLFVFNRTPAFFSDLSLIKTGAILFNRHLYLIALGLVVIISLIAYLAYLANSWLVEVYATPPIITLALLVGVISLAIFDWQKRQKVVLLDWRQVKYKDLHWRNVFSTTLHTIRNVMFCRQYQHILQKKTETYQSKNAFTRLELEKKPNFVFVCIESYGARVYKDRMLTKDIDPLFHKYRSRLDEANYFLSSNFSTSPIYSGGSWLSYCSFMYGLKIENIQLYESLFEAANNFGAYESIFHLLQRNGYKNVLSCPMGGVDNKDVNWNSISRCFQSDLVIDWQKLDFKGSKLPFFGLKLRYCAPDQYVLNHAYDEAKKQFKQPFSLFYCTMNSHIPWISPTEIATDWRSINSPQYQYQRTTDLHKSNRDKYMASIYYQLDTVFDFALKNASDDLVLVIFGDHQPPLITIPRMGLETPVHIITKNHRFNQTFLKHGFINKLRLNGHDGSIRHEGFMSIFANACNQAFGKDTALEFPIMKNGVDLSVK